MATTAFAMADPYCRPVPAQAIVRKREEAANAIVKAMSLTPFDEGEKRKRDDYVTQVKIGLMTLASLSDPIVGRRPPVRGKPKVSTEDYGHARGVYARVRGEGRRLFGKAGDHIAEIFVAAVTGVFLSADDRRTHS
jgi:hypothetical protein